LLPNGILPGAKFTLRPSLAFSYIALMLIRPQVIRPRPRPRTFSTAQGQAKAKHVQSQANRGVARGVQGCGPHQAALARGRATNGENCNLITAILN